MIIKLLIWAALIAAQNFSFTIVSRARNSASLKRHLVASVLSNFIWFVQIFMATDNVTQVLSGKQGIGMAVLYTVVYVAASSVGAITSHWWALRTEKGKARVGAY